MKSASCDEEYDHMKLDKYSMNSMPSSPSGLAMPLVWESCFFLYGGRNMPTAQKQTLNVRVSQQLRSLFMQYQLA